MYSTSELDELFWILNSIKGFKLKQPQWSNTTIHKLSKDDIASIQEHYFSDLISFPLPDKKYQGKCFMRFNVQRSARMYNLADSTRRKISTSTYY